MTALPKQDIISVFYAIGRNAKSKRTKPLNGTWADFVERIVEYAEDGDKLNGNESEAEYKAYKTRLPFISAQFKGDRGNSSVDCRSLLWVDVDAVDESRMARIKRAVRRSGFASLYHTTTGHHHAVKGADTHSGRFLFPTTRPMTAAEIEHCQYAFTKELCLPSTDQTANESARIMFVPAPGAKFREYEGEAVDVDYLLTQAGPKPKKAAQNPTGSTCNDSLTAWAFEMGLDALPSGRGWAVVCPNGLSHSSNDGSDGSTAIMSPDSRNGEVRFTCRHDHCRELNSHQHLALRLCGVPDDLLPEAHNISARTVAELLPDVDADEVSEAECNAVANSACNDDDLKDDESVKHVPQYGKKDWLIKGFYNFASTFELVGESNIGKSFELLSRMACVATGTDYMGWPTRRAHCFYFDAEGGAETETRIAALQQAFNDPLEWLHVVDIQRDCADLADIKDRDAMIKSMINTAAGEPIGIVAFDSLNQTMANYKSGTFDENSSSDMGKVAKSLKAIADGTGACAGVVHHPAKSKAGGTMRVGRGSGALHGAIDFVHFIEAAGEGQLNIYTEKARPMKKAAPFGAQLVQITLDGIEPEPEPERKPFDASKWGLTQHDDPTSHKPNVTLFAVPVRQLPFDSAGGKAGRDAVKRKTRAEVLAFTGDRKAAMNALERLQDAHPERTRGFSSAEIRKEIGDSANGRHIKSLAALVETGLVTYGKDDKGRLLNGSENANGEKRQTQFLLPLTPNAYHSAADDLAD